MANFEKPGPAAKNAASAFQGAGKFWQSGPAKRLQREEIQRPGFGGEELFVDFERGLNVCIQQIRGRPE